MPWDMHKVSPAMLDKIMHVIDEEKRLFDERERAERRRTGKRRR